MEGNEPDTRIEGTAAYLAPELVIGSSAPSPASDCWAFGCLLYQCLAGRPPIWAETDTETVAAVVTFAPTDDKFPAEFPAEAKLLVASLLTAAPELRTGLTSAAAAEFFAGVDVFSLYSIAAPELAGGAAAPEPTVRRYRPALRAASYAFSAHRLRLAPCHASEAPSLRPRTLTVKCCALLRRGGLVGKIR